MNKIFIIAGTYAQAKLCAFKNQVVNYSFVNSPDNLKSLRDDVELWCCGTYFMSPEARDCIQVAMERNIPIIMKKP